MSALVLKESYRVGGDHGRTGRYPVEVWPYEAGLPETPEEFAALMRSDDPLDRVLASVYARNLRVTLPELWVVLEAAHSPNLLRRWPSDSAPPEPKSQEYRVRWHAWSTHVDKADAEAWRDLYDSQAEAQRQNSRWPESSRRIFEVVLAEGASVHTLKQPGAEPWTEAFR